MSETAMTRQRRWAANNPEKMREYRRAYLKRHPERVQEKVKRHRRTYYQRKKARETMPNYKPRRCTCCGQEFPPIRPQQSLCLSPCTPRLVIERERAEAAAAQREREREGAQPQIRSALWRRLNERVC